MRLLPRLLDFLHTQPGLECSGGDLLRDPRAHGAVGEKGPYGKAYSLHKSGLAIDLNVFRNGVYITSSEDPVWEMLGSYWESLHPLCANGRKWQDANHFSIAHDGRM